MNKYMWLILALLATVALVCALTLPSVLIHNKGNVHTANIDVFEDSACTIPLTEIDWGVVYVGVSYNTVCYVYATSPNPLKLSMTYGNFTPANISAVLTLTWNLENATIQPQTPLQAMFTLQISKSDSESAFTFDILVSANEA